MTKFWVRVLRPSGSFAKWLLFLTLLTLFLLNAGGQFEGFRQYLDADNVSFTLGQQRISVYNILNVVLTIAVLLWLSAITVELSEKYIRRIPKLREANRTLMIQFVQIGVYLIAAVLALDLIGLDLTTLAIFGGALGIGLGFGLQKIASNFISGLILLLEKSIETDDLVELTDGTYGFVRKTGARYTLIETFDNKEILVPNEDFITNRVTNWTFSNHQARVEIPVGVSYDSDIKLARQLLIEAASQHPRCMKDPAPVCFLRNFGDSSVDFLLHFWVKDVENGRWLPQSEVMYSIWDKFADNGIKIPFPQRDVHFKSGPIPGSES